MEHSDAATAGGNDRASYPAFTRLAAEIDTSIRHLLPVLVTTERPEVES